MAVIRSSKPQFSSPSPNDLRRKTILCLNKLSDRDTFSIASTELETIAQSLSPDSFSSFLSCIYGTDSTHKTPVRKQCVRIFSILALAHEDSLSPCIPKILQNIICRLRDPDSAVRSACIDAASILASRVTKPPFSAFFTPLSEAVLIDQDQNVQIGASMCLAAVVDSAACVDVSQLKRIMPRFVKLLKCESFKAKPALISLIASIVNAGGARNLGLLKSLVPCLTDCLSSEDWSTRKAAAEALLNVALMEKGLIGELKRSCMIQFEARRFDKVKATREAMKRMLEAWRDVLDSSDSSRTSVDQCASSSKESENGHTPNSSQSSNVLRSEPSLKVKCKSYVPKSYPFLSNSSLTEVHDSNLRRKRVETTQKNENGKPNQTFEGDVLQTIYLKGACPDTPKSAKETGKPVLDKADSIAKSKPDVRRSLFSAKIDEKGRRYSNENVEFHTHAMPFNEKCSAGSTAINIVSDEFCGDRTADEELVFIRNKLIQIENQQSSLLELLQTFIGTCQSGMSSLEARVHGLEIAMDEISHELAASTWKLRSQNNINNKCFSIPGADFLSSKLRGRVYSGRYSSSKMSASGTTTFCSFDDPENQKMKSNRRVILNPLAEIRSHLRGSSEVAAVNAVCSSQGDIHFGTT